MVAKLGVAGDVVHPLVIGQHRDDLVIHFAAIVEFHDANNPGLHNRSGHQGFGDTNDFNIQGVTVLVPGAGNASIGKGIGEGGIAHPIQLEVSSFRDQLVLVDRHGIELNDRVEPQFRFIGEGRQHVQQVEHRAAGGVVDIRHEKESFCAAAS